MVYFLDQTHTYEYVATLVPSNADAKISRHPGFLTSHPWALVNQGIWRKYPNRECAHVISVDVLDRSIDPTTGILRTERVLGVRQKAPLWVLKVCFHLKMRYHVATRD